MTAGKFRRLRQDTGLTQAELGKTLGVDRVTVARWETGARRIPEMAARLLKRIWNERRP
jgi:DNA-binding transcriptional regulator YiaG